jgi:diguanylate cyclase (GGDEF)-like protein/PAS domain S-box-containing protein
MKKQQTDSPGKYQRKRAGQLLELQTAALEAAENAILITDREATIVWANTAFQRLTGYTKEEAVGQNARLLKSGQHPASFYQQIWETILSGRKWQGELVNRRKDGSLYREQLAITPVQDKKGEITHFIASLQDVTERTHTDEQMYRLVQAVEHSSELIAMGDREGHLIFANRAFLQAVGYSKEEASGKHFWSFHSANNPPGLDQEVGGKSLEDGGWRGEYLFCHRNGTDIPVLLSVGPIKDKEGRAIGSFGISRDISDRKRAEENLRRSEEQFRELAENIREVFFILTPDPFQVTYLSPAYEEISGRPCQEIYDRPEAWTDAIQPADRERAVQLLEQAKRGEAAETEYRIVRPDGEIRWISARTFPVHDSQGKFCRVVGTAEDITERKKTEDALKQSETKFKALFATANDAILIMNGAKFSDCNLRAETFFRCGKEDIVGRSPLDFSPSKQPDGRLSSEKVAEKVQAALTGLPQFFEWEHLRHDGTSFDAEVSVNKVITPGADYLLAIVRDITERKQADSKLQEANMKLSIAFGESEQNAREAVKLTELVDILQSCQTVEEAYKITANNLPTILSSQSGALCITSPSRNIVEAVAMWGDTLAVEKTFAPDNCWALRRGKIHRVNDKTSPLRCAHVSEASADGYLCVPLAAQGETLGVLCLERPPQAPSPSLRSPEDQMEAFARQASAVAERDSLALANLRLREVLRSQSIRDPLTGLFNRRYMEESFEREVRRAARNNESVTLIMLDIDHFKQFNDTFGHQAGDTLLRGLGDFLSGRTRGQDVACRYGGEEFVLILAGASADDGCKRAELLRQELKQLTVQHAGQVLGRITVSIGISAFPGHGATAEELLRTADPALYRAKAQGRDRIVVAVPVNTGS